MFLRQAVVALRATCGGSVPALRTNAAITFSSPSSTASVFGNVCSLRVARVPEHVLCNALRPYATNFSKRSELSAQRLLDAYRRDGHLAALLDPLQPDEGAAVRAARVPWLSSSLHGFAEESDGSERVPALLSADSASTSLAAFEARLQEIYCGALTAEVSHLHSPEEYEWLTSQLESEDTDTAAIDSWEVEAWKLMARSEEFDHFMGRRFAGVKRYGLEGLESLVAGLHVLLSRSNERGVESVVVGMAHRGRLNLLSDLLGLGPEAVFNKVSGGSELPPGEKLSADVLSHLGVSGPVRLGEGRSVHSTLLHNPSHLELVDPVAVGKARAKQEALVAAERCSVAEARKRVMALLVHGDAAMIGQGVVPETMQLSSLPSFTVGGTLHVVTNNQLGFTAAATYGRSSRYPTCIMHATGTPVLHANAESLAAVHKACCVAADYRARFQRDVVVNLVGYRRHGHNELDEPSFTQPAMYRAIRSRPTFPQMLELQLVSRGLLTAEEAAVTRQEERERLDEALRSSSGVAGLSLRHGNWAGVPDTATSTRAEFEAGGSAGQLQPETGVDLDLLRTVARASVTTPDGFAVHKRLLSHHCKARLRRVDADPAERTLDWATAEAMALGSLLADGRAVRFCGQDAVRGTFSHRHLGVADQQTGERHYPFGAPDLQFASEPTTLEQQLGRPTGRLHIVDSPLSELAVLGYEYGVSLETPQRLCLWEAQFGDFVNAAQMVVDQFLATSDEKWGRQTALTLLLPHGMDGAGPEHSTCRVERFLQLCNDPHDQPPVRQVPHNPNMHVVWPSTPASYFHALRRQLSRQYRKPAVIVGPKTLLRHPDVVSALEELAPSTRFQPVLPDPRFEPNAAAGPLDPQLVQLVVCCSGRIYYDLAKQLSEMEPEASARIAVVRLEELSPFPHAALRNQLSRFPNAWQLRWVQEEHANMGAWSFVRPRLHLLSTALKVANGAANPLLTYVGRDHAASVTGLSSVHKQECADLLEKALKFRARN
mmetsp:Transcript_51111/g.128236  ORF Transcript_51111/g.128236 Transcript_51111/m.128236 type:complete len:1000 (-) Transcript_51111:192-3191(-)